MKARFGIWGGASRICVDFEVHVSCLPVSELFSQGIDFFLSWVRFGFRSLLILLLRSSASKLFSVITQILSKSLQGPRPAFVDALLLLLQSESSGFPLIQSISPCLLSAAVSFIRCSLVRFVCMEGSLQGSFYGSALPLMCVKVAVM